MNCHADNYILLCKTICWSCDIYSQFLHVFTWSVVCMRINLKEVLNTILYTKFMKAYVILYLMASYLVCMSIILELLIKISHDHERHFY
jgi:hypothetical protein